MKKIFSIMLIAMAMMMITSCLEEEKEKLKYHNFNLSVKALVSDSSVPVSITGLFYRVSGTTDWGVNQLAAPVSAIQGDNIVIGVLPLDGETAETSGYDLRIETSLGNGDITELNYNRGLDVEQEIYFYIPLDLS